MVASAVVALLGSRLQHARKRLDRREERPNAASECRVCANLFHALGLNFSEACTPDSQECDSVLGILRVSPGTQYLGTLTLWSQMERIQHIQGEEVGTFLVIAKLMALCCAFNDHG